MKTKYLWIGTVLLLIASVLLLVASRALEIQNEKISVQEQRLAETQVQIQMLKTQIAVTPYLSVALDSGTPTSQTVSGDHKILFVQLRFSAYRSDVVVRGLVITRDGGSDMDLEDISLYDATMTWMSSLKRMTNGKGYFGGLNWVITADTTNALGVYAKISESAPLGTKIRLGISNGNGVDTRANLDGRALPAMGAYLTIMR